MSKLLYLSAEGIRSLWRARMPAAGSILTITITLMLFGGAYILTSNFDRATRRLQSQYRIDVFFDPLVKNQDAFEIYRNLKKIEGIASTEFINKERAAKIFKKEFGEDVVAVLGSNPLPAGAIVLVAKGHRTARRINRIADSIAELQSVTDVAYRGELVRILERYLQIAVYGGIVLGVLTLWIAIFLVSNTIKLSLYAKRATLETLHLLGATRRFIRFPFMIEGTIQGLLGAMLATSALYGALNLMNYILGQFVLYRIIRPSELAPGLIVFGMLLGFVGSYRSLRKFTSPKNLSAIA